MAVESKAPGQLLVRQGACFVGPSTAHVHMYEVCTRFSLIRSLTYFQSFGSFCGRKTCHCDCRCCLLDLFSGVSKQDAQVALKGTTSGDKNELLFSRFDTNYNEIPQRFRKGTTLFRARPIAVAPQSPEQSQQPPPQDGKAADGADEPGGGAPLLAGSATPEGASGEEVSTEQRGSEKTHVQVSILVPTESVGGAGSPVDENPVSGLAGGEPQAGTVSPPPPPGKKEGDKMSGMRGKGRTAGEAKAACADSAVVRVVSCGDGKGRSKRLLKKGHAPPGVIEEDACDLIRDDFWERNPHILARSAATRR